MVSFTMLQLKFALFCLVVLDTGDRFYSLCSVFRCKDFSHEIKSPVILIICYFNMGYIISLAIFSALA